MLKYVYADTHHFSYMKLPNKRQRTPSHLLLTNTDVVNNVVRFLYFHLPLALCNTTLFSALSQLYSKPFDWSLPESILSSPSLVRWALGLDWQPPSGNDDEIRPRSAMAIAALLGKLDVLQLLHNIGCKWNNWTCAWGAQGGNLEVLQLLHANGCSWGVKTCAAAARYGHLKVLQWARANGCTWDESTCKAAAEGGHLEVLQWARAYGCPYDEGACIEALTLTLTMTLT